jgi:hypothetical protein
MRIKCIVLRVSLYFIPINMYRSCMRLFSGDVNQTALTLISNTISLVTLAYCAYFGKCVLIGYLTK